MEDLWRELLDRLRAMRFSLATLLFGILFIGSVVATWVNREPWEIAAKVRLSDTESDERVGLTPMGEDGRILVEREHRSHRLTIWNWHTGEVIPVPIPKDELLLETAPATGRFLTGDRAGTARVHQIGTPGPLVELQHWVFTTASNLRLSADGNRVAGAGPDGAVWLYDIDAQKETSFPARSESPTLVHLEFSGDGHWLQVLERVQVKGRDAGTNPYESTAFYAIDCDLGVTVDAPNDVTQYIFQYEMLGHSFNGSTDRIFCYQKHWRVGAEHLQDAPGIRLPWVSTTDQQTQSAAFLAPHGEIELWSADMTVRQGSADASALPKPPGGVVTRKGHYLIVRAVQDGRHVSVLFDIRTGQVVHILPTIAYHFLGKDEVLGIDGSTGEFQVWRRRRAESAWGLLGLPEVWLALVFLVATVLSVRRDRRRLWSAPL